VEVYELSVPESLDGARLDKALTELVPGASRARVKKAIESGSVRINGRRAPKGTQVKTGDALSVSLEGGTELASSDAPATPEPAAPLQVRWKTPKVLVVDKPAGQPSAPLKGGETGTLANALVGHFPELGSGSPGVGYSPREAGLLHRLDNDTSGLLVVGRTAEAFAALRDALHADRICKSYLLVCREEGLPDEGTIAFPIANHPKDQRRVYACVHPRDVMRYAPRPASTDYRVLERRGGWARVEVSVARALRHQIRVHFAAIEHPLAGDVLYGGEAIAGLDRHALHASRVALEDADAELAFDVSSPLPPELEALLAEDTVSPPT
jgi:23S rRNA pseudouridine1911/1915/1917 synthase